MPNTHSLDLESSSSQLAAITDAAQSGLDITGDITIEAWIKPESVGVNGVIVAKAQIYLNNRGYQVYFLTDNKLYFQISADGAFASTIASDNAFLTSDDVGNWVHVAVVVDVSATTGYFYKDGKQVATTTTGSATSIYNNASPFQIGANNSGTNGAPAVFFDGKIDDVRVWNDIRTAQEIKDNFLKELTGSESNLVGYWKLNEDYTDQTSNGNDLTPSGSPVFSADPAFVESNLYAADFEESSSQRAYITNTNQVNLGPTTNDFTIEMWLKLESQPIDSGNRFVLVDKLQTSPATNGYLFRYYNASGEYRILMNLANSGNNAIGWVVHQFTTGVWTHVAIVVDVSAADAEVFINGVSIGTISATGVTSLGASTADFSIGGSAVQSQYFDGLIDDVRFWSDARTAQEILENYGKRLVGNEANLEGYWRMDNNFADSTNNVNYLTPSGSPVFSSDHSPFVGILSFLESINSEDSISQDILKYFSETIEGSESFFANLVTSVFFSDELNLTESFSKLISSLKSFHEVFINSDSISSVIGKLLLSPAKIVDSVNIFLSSHIFHKVVEVDISSRTFLQEGFDQINSSDSVHLLRTLTRSFLDNVSLFDMLRQLRSVFATDSFNVKDYLSVFKNGISVAWEYIYEIKNTIWHTRYKK